MLESCQLRPNKMQEIKIRKFFSDKSNLRNREIGKFSMNSDYKSGLLISKSEDFGFEIQKYRAIFPKNPKKSDLFSRKSGNFGCFVGNSEIFKIFATMQEIVLNVGDGLAMRES